MTKWAKKAGSLVFQDAEDLNHDNIVTHCNLSLFWHSQGSWRISYLHKGNSPTKTSTHLLILSGNACQLLHIIGPGSNTPTLESEIRRRRFWACYLMHCFSSEKLFRFEAIADFENLPLPWSEDSFEAGIPPDKVATIENGVDTGSVFAELIRGLHLWYLTLSPRETYILTFVGVRLSPSSDLKTTPSMPVSRRSSKPKARSRRGGNEYPVTSNLTLLPPSLQTKAV